MVSIAFYTLVQLDYCFNLVGQPLHKSGRIWCHARLVPSQPGVPPNQIAPHNFLFDWAVPSMCADQSGARSPC